MSQLKVNSIVDASGGSNAQLYGVASPPNSMGFRNRILNGGMVIDQRNAGASVTPSASFGYTLDRWGASEDTDGACTVQQVTDAPTGFVNSLRFTTTTADSSLSATQFAYVGQFIEGLNVADLAWGSASAQTITLSFWVKSSLTGTFGGALTNSAFNRSYPFTYSISAANTWEQKSVTIAGDTSGTWLTTNGVGIRVQFGMGVGSTYSGTAGSWAGSQFISATGAVSVIGTLNATWQITGVQLEAGTVASPFERRDYGRELMMCQRYYYRIQATGGNQFFGVGFNELTTRHQTITMFPVQLRVAPTALEQSGTASNYRINHGATNTDCSSVPTWNGSDTLSARTEFTVASGLTVGQGAASRSNNSSAYLAWSAEL